jgi:hypothetical protein
MGKALGSGSQHRKKSSQCVGDITGDASTDTYFPDINPREFPWPGPLVGNVLCAVIRSPEARLMSS